MGNLFANYTPHIINIITADGTKTSISPCGTVARVSVKRELIRTYCGIEIYDSVFGDLEGYPEKLNTGNREIYIVSRIFLDAAKEKGYETEHLYAPGELIRDEDGQVVGCNGLSK